jgi:hypothetical protein
MTQMRIYNILLYAAHIMAGFTVGLFVGDITRAPLEAESPQKDSTVTAVVAVPANTERRAVATDTEVMASHAGWEQSQLVNSELWNQELRRQNVELQRQLDEMRNSPFRYRFKTP